MATSSTSSRIWLIGRDVSAVIQAIGVSSSELTAWITGASAPSGRSWTRSSFSETSSRARSLLVPQSNRRTIRLLPSVEDEVISASASTELRRSSWRSVTSCSTSCGAAPR